jgi:predicted  nucleic acid-binding Zn-ribbon protein
MSKRDDVVNKMKRQLDEWKVEIDRLEDTVKKVKSDLKAKYEGQIRELRQKRNDGEKKLEELRASGEDAWERVRKETEHAWTAIKDSVNTFKSHYKKDTAKKDD